MIHPCNLKQFGPKLGRTYTDECWVSFVLIGPYWSGSIVWPQDHLTMRHIWLRNFRTSQTSHNSLLFRILWKPFWPERTPGPQRPSGPLWTSWIFGTFWTSLTFWILPDLQSKYLRQNKVVIDISCETILSIIFNLQIYWCFLGFNIFTDQVQQFIFIMKFMVTKKDKVSNYLVHLMIILLGSYFTYCSKIMWIILLIFITVLLFLLYVLFSKTRPVTFISTGLIIGT